MRTIVETPSFAKDADTLMGKEHLDELKEELARNPRAGDLIAETGGFRKIRGRRTGSGQRGGVRVFYYPSKEGPLYLFACIAKADDAPFTKEQCSALRGLAREFEMGHMAPVEGGGSR